MEYDERVSARHTTIPAKKKGTAIMTVNKNNP
jgi:hypothetical protein